MQKMCEKVISKVAFYAMQKMSFHCEKEKDLSLRHKFLTLFLLGGGGAICPPPVVFLHNSKSIGLRLLKFPDFSYIPKALPLSLNRALILTA